MAAKGSCLSPSAGERPADNVLSSNAPAVRQVKHPGAHRRAGLEIVIDFADAADGVAIAASVHVEGEEHHGNIDDGAVQVAGCEDRLQSDFELFLGHNLGKHAG